MGRRQSQLSVLSLYVRSSVQHREKSAHETEFTLPSVLTAINESVVVLLVSASGIVRSLELDGDLTSGLAIGTEAH